MLVTALSMGHKRQSQPGCPSIDDLLKKVHCISIEDYSSMKNEILPFAEKWVEVLDSMLSEISQSKITFFSSCID